VQIISQLENSTSSTTAPAAARSTKLAAMHSTSTITTCFSASE
jgi:hypothetical protein